MGHLEKKLLVDTNLPKPKSYCRFIDDIFTVWDRDTDYRPFLDALNNQHRNIVFTVEHGGNSLSFLNVQVSIVDGLETWVFRKPTYTKVILNQSAVCPWIWKNGLLVGFLNTA